MKVTASLFDQLKASLNTASSGGGERFKDILKFEQGKTYQVRLLFNFNNPKETFFHHYFHGWTSVKTGKYVTGLCPSTFGESCPIDEYVIKTYRTGTESEKKTLSDIKRKENWYVNVYVISDPTNPENEGQVKIMKYGKELNAIIMSAIEGDDAEEFGPKVFDLKNGCSLRVKCETRSNKGPGASRNFITYAASKFLSPSTIEVDEEEVASKLHNLTNILKKTSYKEMQTLIDEHWFCKSETEETTEDSTPAAKPSVNKNVPAPVEELDVFKGVEEATTTSPSKSKIQDLIDSIGLDD